MIYAVRAVGTGFIKFGRTGHQLEISRRLSALQIGCPFELVLVATCKGAKTEESSIHAYLIQAGVHHRGEWFKEGEAVEQVLKHMGVGENRLPNMPPANVLELRRRHRHRRLGVVLDYAEKVKKEG